MNKDDQAFVLWYHGEATPEEKALCDKVYELADLFEDMTFQPGTTTYRLIQCKSKSADSDEWVDDAVDLPDDLQYLSYTWFHYKVEELSDCGGYYNPESQTLCVPPSALEDETVILHEMIHLHETVINEQPLYFHDTLLWALYADLKKKIPKLDEIISDHAHVLNEWALYRVGGLHDILFLLKSFDLDIRRGYPLGTVFAYGRDEDFQGYSYIAEVKSDRVEPDSEETPAQ